MYIRCAICDDQPDLLQNLHRTLDAIAENLQIDLAVFPFSSGRNLLYEIQDQTTYDIVILDIEMPGKSGIETARDIRQYDDDCLILFLTSHLEYAAEAYELNIFRYIPKPKLSEKLPAAIADAARQLQTRCKQCYLISKPHLVEKIPFQNIIYILKDGKYCTLFCRNNQTVSVRKPIAAVLRELPGDLFTRVDRGCIVNMQHARRLENHTLLCCNGIRLPVSRSKLQTVRQQFFRVRGSYL